MDIEMGKKDPLQMETAINGEAQVRIVLPASEPPFLPAGAQRVHREDILPFRGGLRERVVQYRNMGLPLTCRTFGRYSSAS